MKTLVYQSFRGPPPPAWLGRCMRSAQRWADLRGYDYAGDLDLFEFVPGWFRDKAGPLLNVVADLARLNMARRFLDEGYDRTVWLDADVVVFDAEGFTLDLTQPMLLCGEVWLSTPDERTAYGEGPLVCTKKVTNSLAMFSDETELLDRYIETTLRVVREAPGRAGRLSVSTELLTAWAERVELPLCHSVGMFSPVFKRGFLDGDEALLELYASAIQAPIRCANLCFAHRGMVRKGVRVDDRLFQETITRLEQSRGAEFNDRFWRLRASAPLE